MRARSLLLALVLAAAAVTSTAQVNTGAKTVSILTFGANTTCGADVATAFNAAVAAGASRITVPPGCYLLGGAATVNLANIDIDCQGAPAQYNQPPTYGSAGATFQMTSTSVQPFALAGGVRFRACNFYWPNQNGTNPTPTAYPPLFTEQAGKQLSAFQCASCRVINAYDFMDQTSSSDAFGAIQLSDTIGYAIRYWFQLSNVTEWITVTGFWADFGLFQNVANNGPNYYLANWTAANGAFLHVFGNGNGSTVGSTVHAAGFVFHGAIYAYNKFIWVDSTGALGENKFFGIYDAVPHVIQVDAGGCLSDTEVDGTYYSYQATFPNPAPGGTDNATTFSIATPPSSNCGNNGIRITGHLFSAQGDVLDVIGAGTKSVYLGVSGGGAYGSSSTAGTYYFAQINGSQAIVDIVGNHIEAKTANSSHQGINAIQCYTCNITGNSFNGVYNPIIIGAGMAGTQQVIARGNISLNAPAGSVPILGTGDSAHHALVGNVWDRQAPPTFGACGTGPALANGRSNDISGIITVGTGTVTSCTLNFANVWTTAPGCRVSGGNISAYPIASTSTTSTMVITSTATMGGMSLFYDCKPAGI